MENRHVKQEPGGSRRRWFDGDSLELIVWLDAAGKITGFQLCYDPSDGQRALTWTAAGFEFSRVDTGDTSPLKNETPVLLPDGGVPWAEVAAKFAIEDAALEPELRDFVATRLAARV